MKKFIHFFVAMMFTFTCFSATTAFAADDPTPLTLDEHTAILIENGIPRLISNEEAEQLLASEDTKTFDACVTDESPVESAPARASAYRYVVDSTSTGYNYSMRKKVTPDVMGPAVLNYAESCTFTRTYSAGVSASIANAVSVTLGAAASSTNNTSVSYNYDVPDGKIGYIQFTPRIKTSFGRIQTLSGGSVSSSSSLTVYDPVIANSFCDGLYQLIVD
ncbi:MAG: hypothetical protein ACOYIE_00645 [Agathobaculum sp.]|jgi:hypothetical protein|uniref:hypothetical protein n=1 Tax=Agathobaculum sp. TaxID=2048138 RepID=UPI003D8CA38D